MRVERMLGASLHRMHRQLSPQGYRRPVHGFDPEEAESTSERGRRGCSCRGVLLWSTLHRMPRKTEAPQRLLATVLFTDIVGSTERAAEVGDKRWRQIVSAHHGLIRRQLKRYSGREIDTAGDGFFATFDQPAQAIRCAEAIVQDVRRLGIEVRVGIHMGEVEVI